MPISSKLRTTRAVLARTPAYSMIQVEEVDGKLVFVNSVTGQRFKGPKAFTDAMAYADALRIADYREISPFGETVTGRITGAQANADRVLRLNSYLSDPANRAALAAVGLENLSGGSVSGRMILFDTRNTKSSVDAISRTISTNAPGEVVLTDGGIQLFSLSQAVTSAGEAITLSRAQQDVLKQLSKINIFDQDDVGEFFGFVGQALDPSSTPEIINSALGKIGKRVGKMTKRYQSAFSPRDVSSGANILNRLVSESIISGTADEYNLIVDRTEAILKTAAGGYDLLSDEEKVLIARSIEGAQAEDIGIPRGLPTGGELSENIFVPKRSDSAAQEAFKFIEETLQIRLTDVVSGAPGTYVPDDYIADSDELRKLLQSALAEQQSVISSGATPKKLVEIVQEKYDLLPAALKTKNLEDMVGKLGASIETMNDGHYLLVEKAQKRILEIKQEDLNNLISSGSIDEIKLRQINQLQNEIESIQSAIESGDRNPTRIGIPGIGQLKGEAAVVTVEEGILGAEESDFRALEEIRDTYSEMIRSGKTLSAQEQAAYEYSEMMLRLRSSFSRRLSIADASAVKTEIITEDPFLTQNIAKSKGSGVFVEDMLLLNDPEFIQNPYRVKRVQAMIDAEIRSAREFMESGKIPREVLDQLRHTANLDFSSMAPAARALAIINRKQAIEITQALRAGIDPRNIPALVNMISKHHISQAFKTEEGIAAVRIPDALRYKIATRTSLQKVTGFETSALSTANINTSSGVAQLPMVNFAISGKQMVVADSVASTYKPALGGFDLDDSGLPILGTYQDESGRTRIAAVAMRDPKGMQESILMKPQLAHAETLRAMLVDDSDRIARQVAAATPAEIYSLVTKVRDSADIGQIEAQQVVDLAMDVIKREKTLHPRVLQERLRAFSTSSADSDVALETVVRILREGMYGSRLAEDVSDLAPINQRFLEALAERGSASIRGRDVLDPATGLPVGPFSRLSVEQGAPYSYKYLTEIAREADSVDPKNMQAIRTSLLETLGVRSDSLSPSELSTLFSRPRRSCGRCAKVKTWC